MNYVIEGQSHSLTHSLFPGCCGYQILNISRNWVFIRISLKLSCDSAIKGTHVTVKGCLAADGCEYPGRKAELS